MIIRTHIKSLALIVGAALSLGLFSGAEAAQEPQYRYGYFRLTSYTLADPTRSYCPQCRVPNRQTSETMIHSAIFELPDRKSRVDLFETGREFCNQARRHFGEEWWRQRGFTDCLGGGLTMRETYERVVDDLERDYKYKTTRPAEENSLVYQFDNFTPKNFKLVVLRWPGAKPAPAARASTSSSAQTSGTTRFTQQPSISSAAASSVSSTSRPPVQPESMPVTSAQELAEIATRERLNREQAAFAAKQVADNAAAKAAFDKATADRAATIAAQKAEADRRQREYDAAMAKWRADVEACQKGDISRCAP